MLLSTSQATLRTALRCPSPSQLTPSSSLRSFSSSRPAHAAPALSANVDHYQVLGLQRDATRKQIKDKFYELSRKHHPDAPSSSSETPEQRTARFQQLSQSYSVLSDPQQRKSYDLSRTGSSIPPHRRRPGYTAASGGMGYAGGGEGAGYTDNDERRERANYAWQHPKRGTSAGEQAAGAAGARTDPFASRRGRTSGAQTADHFSAYAERARIRHTQAVAAASRAGQGAAGEDSHYRAGTSVFGAAKAAEESRLINDSSTLRSGQVVFVFAAVFFLAYAFSDRSAHEKQANSVRR
ncbi:hypothetical protein JCM11641_005878 [Rhodosporidiobolus odoratus]